MSHPSRTPKSVRVAAAPPENPAWVPCEACDDYLCVIHDCHTSSYRCECPSMGAWDALGIDPYTSGGDLTPASLAALIADCPDAQEEA